MADRRSEFSFANSQFLLTGGTGFLGNAVLQDLLRMLPATATIVMCGRSVLECERHPRLNYVVCDFKSGAIPDYALMQSDYVIWMAANRDHAETLSGLWAINVGALIKALKKLRTSNRLKRLIYVSSVSAVDLAIGRTWPMSDETIPSPSTPYGVSKLLAEIAVCTSGLPATVLRLPFLYGPNFPPSSFLAWYVALGTGRVVRSLPMPGQLSLLYTGDFAAVCLAVLGSEVRDATDASPYLVSDGKSYIVDDLIGMVATIIGGKKPFVRLPIWTSEVANRMLAFSPYRYWRHAAFDAHYFTVDSARFRRTFDNVSFTSLEVGLPAALGVTGPNAAASGKC